MMPQWSPASCARRSTHRSGNAHAWAVVLHPDAIRVSLRRQPKRAKIPHRGVKHDDRPEPGPAAAYVLSGLLADQSPADQVNPHRRALPGACRARLRFRRHVSTAPRLISRVRPPPSCLPTRETRPAFDCIRENKVDRALPGQLDAGDPPGRRTAFVRITTTDGVVGYGEASPMQGGLLPSGSSSGTSRPCSSAPMRSTRPSHDKMFQRTSSSGRRAP